MYTSTEYGLNKNWWDGKTTYVTDVGSTNGTRDRNGNQLITNTPEPINVGDSFEIPGMKIKRLD